jgi:predicted small metal-binding protein
MAKLCCVDYGFECAFVSESIDDSAMIEEFAKHTSDEHGIEYSKEALMQFMLRKHNSNKFEDVYMYTA